MQKCYRKTEVTGTWLEIEAFNFSNFNKTEFHGLEASEPSACFNALLQVLYFLGPLRLALLNHTCEYEFCLACELSFLFHMLDQHSARPCQPKNFLRALRSISSVSGPKLRDMEKMYKFLLIQIYNELSRTSQSSCPVTKILGHSEKSIWLCRACGNFFKRSTIELCLNLPYTKKTINSNRKVAFSKLMELAFNAKSKKNQKCDFCGEQDSLPDKRLVQSLPDIIALNCRMNSAEKANFWKTQEKIAEMEFGKRKTAAGDVIPWSCRPGATCQRGHCHFQPSISSPRSWIPPGLKLICNDDGTVTAVNVDERDLPTLLNEEKTVHYELYATVASIHDPSGSIHAVSHIRPSLEYYRSGEQTRQWYLFNDFTIEPVDSDMATKFDCDWKRPRILFFARTDLSSRHDIPVIDPITSDSLFVNKSLVTPRDITFTPLSESELPLAGRIFGIDAEYVNLDQEENASDDQTSTKPSLQAVARVTCVRESGPLQGVPFIDDYISTRDQIGDYLTKFSGILPGDLDVTTSRKHLTTLKWTYLKLRYLISEKVIFVGHGLKNDFKILNIIVPEDQIIDTLEIFHLPNRRNISLKFLAWYYLGINIQSATHDSTEDSNTAINLYSKYRELSLKGEDELLAELKNLYDVGYHLQWKVPE